MVAIFIGGLFMLLFGYLTLYLPMKGAETVAKAAGANEEKSENFGLYIGIGFFFAFPLIMIFILGG